MGKIIGLGGVFVKFKDPKAMNEWYNKTLMMNVNDYGVLFCFNHSAEKRGYLQLGTFPETSNYFGNSDQKVMLNFRVADLVTYVEELKQKNVKILDEMEVYDYGKFIHIEDPEGNRIELWEPIESSFDNTEISHKMY